MKKSPTQIISFRVPNKEYWELTKLGHKFGLDTGPITRALMRTGKRVVPDLIGWDEPEILRLAKLVFRKEKT